MDESGIIVDGAAIDVGGSTVFTDSRGRFFVRRSSSRAATLRVLVDEFLATGRFEVVSAPASPWQNPYVERLIGSIRRDCLNHFVILNAKHLKRTLASYLVYYHGSRTHLGLAKQCPSPRQVSSSGRIIEIPQLGGLHHRYERVAA